MGINVIVSNDAVFITGEWTLPVSKELAMKILGESYQHKPNDGLFLIDGTDRMCLSILPVDVAKIALSESEIDNLKQQLVM